MAISNYWRLNGNSTNQAFSGGIKEIKYDSVVWSEAGIRNEYARLKGFF